MDVVALENSFGVKLAAGTCVAPGVLVQVNSSGQGVIAQDSSTARKPHGFSLTSGCGTKTTGLSQYVRLNRTGRVVDIGRTLTKGGKVYCIDGGLYDTTAPATTNYIVGFALDDDEVYVDLDVSAL